MVALTGLIRLKPRYGYHQVGYSSLNPASVIFTDKLHIKKPRFRMRTNTYRKGS